MNLDRLLIELAQFPFLGLNPKISESLVVPQHRLWLCEIQRRDLQSSVLVPNELRNIDVSNF